MNRDEIMQILPHRQPMLLVDDMHLEGETCVSHYRIREDEFFTQGHFPGNPVVPGVILCEIMAQGCTLLIQEELKEKLALYAGIKEAQFKRVVCPGDVVETRATLVAKRGPLVIIDATATVEGQVCSKGILSFMLVAKQQG